MLRRPRRGPDPRRASPLPGADAVADIDTAALEQPWRAAVEEALQARTRLRDLAAQPGSEFVRDRLAGVAARVDAAVLASWRSALHAQAATRMLGVLDLDAVQQRLKDARRRQARAGTAAADTRTLDQEVALLADQHRSLSELRNTVDDAAEHLRLLDLRVDAAVARAAQIVLGRQRGDALADVERDLTAVVDELEALRAGLDAVGGLEP